MSLAPIIEPGTERPAGFVESGLRFPPPGAGQPSPLRVWKERCLLHAIQYLRPTRPQYASAWGIVTYHQVAEATRGDRAMLNVTPGRFRRHMEGLLRLGYEPWSLRRMLEYERAGEPIPREAFAVVFDDGFEDVYGHAWPVLRQLKIPATVFLATAYLDAPGPFPFDTWSGADPVHTHPARSRPLRVAQCHEMLAAGLVELGSHTHTHQDFRGRPAEFQRDLQQSVERLQSEFGISQPTFSFPYGFADPRLVAAARETAVICGLTAENQLVRPGSDPFAWGRFGATEFDTARSLAAKLDGWYSYAHQLARRVRDCVAGDG